MAAARYTEIDHTADIGIDVSADTLEELFACAADGMFHLILDAVPEDLPRQRVVVRVSADSRDELLREWLAELLYRHATRRVYFIAYCITHLSETSLEAETVAVPLTDAMTASATELKAVTYHALRVRRHADGFDARVIFDT